MPQPQDAGSVESRIVGLKELRDDWPSIERRLLEGQPHLISRHNHVVAILLPMPASGAASPDPRELVTLAGKLTFLATRIQK